MSQLRIDVVTVFPEYFTPLELSLIGKASRDGLVEVNVHDLRTFTEDRHRTVDDTPYGGGPGMLMQPEPWARALDHVFESSPDRFGRPHLVVPSPAGRRFDQDLARQWSQEPWLVFACGRYEGIDQRVIDEARRRVTVTEVSLGDYVLNGGEVAALAVVEAVVRLLPGVLGNQDSLLEESHTEGLLEAASYTKPASWRGHDVPPVLLSGDHAAIARWRRDQSLLRTSRVRPDLIEALNPANLDSDDLEVLAECGWRITDGRFSTTGRAVAD